MPVAPLACADGPVAAAAGTTPSATDVASTVMTAAPAQPAPMLATTLVPAGPSVSLVWREAGRSPVTFRSERPLRG